MRQHGVEGTAFARRLDQPQRQQQPVAGAGVPLGAADADLLESCTEPGPVGREPEPGATDGLNATIFRLRRAIERATPATLPLQSKSRVRHVFKAPLMPAQQRAAVGRWCARRACDFRRQEHADQR